MNEKTTRIGLLVAAAIAAAVPSLGERRLPIDSVAIKKRARELGLDVCGITNADPARRAAFYQQWTAEGNAGEMQWLAREPERRADPRKVLPDAKSIIVAGLNYWQPQPEGRGRIARGGFGCCGRDHERTSIRPTCRHGP